MAQVGQVNTLEQVLRNHIGNGFFYMMFEKKNGNMREGIYKFGVRNKSKSYIDGQTYTTSGKPSTMPKELGTTVCEFSNRQYIEKQAELNGEPEWQPHDFTNLKYHQIRLLRYGGTLKKVDIEEDRLYRITTLQVVPAEFEQSAKLLMRSGIDFSVVGLSHISVNN